MVYVVSKYGTPEHVFSDKVDAFRYIFDEGEFSDEELENLSINSPIISDGDYTITECPFN